MLSLKMLEKIEHLMLEDSNSFKLLNLCKMYSRKYIYCPFQVLVQTNFRQFYFYFLPDQAQTHLDHWKVLNKLWCKISFKSDNG